MRTFLVAFVAIALVAIHLASPAAARVAPTPATEQDTVVARAHADQVSLDQAVAKVQAQYKARVMRANTVEEKGRVVHYIRLMDPETSRVWTVRVDAATGREF
jgi:uncharacterized membrane protein YkoI